MKLYIKYMVSLRCRMIVKEELDRLEIPHLAVDLGMVDIPGSISGQQIELP